MQGKKKAKKAGDFKGASRTKRGQRATRKNRKTNQKKKRLREWAGPMDQMGKKTKEVEKVGQNQAAVTPLNHKNQRKKLKIGAIYPFQPWKMFEKIQRIRHWSQIFCSSEKTNETLINTSGKGEERRKSQ